ncbi:L-asparaginase II [Streptosporangium becharense]|uniref:L-asparaginase II n=1 Tax=Streptosporangium becharense TaxID=1816182 RepID=A0A7W9IGK7_9ACTN|nr:asparaginase [Streptosporangium becharense]MBB2909253.1 L-asparaginase II [Streptosporangium becharense]MBB5819728.1 L-asparaginase II [Streptosporangium becharense]
MSAESLLVEVVRSGFVESTHRVRMLAVAADGSPVRVHGAVDALVSPRSSLKPLQALAMVRAGLPLEGELLALSCASHAGESFHVDGVRRILAGAGLEEDALGCPEDLPEDPASREELLRSGGDRARVYMNCSGKHAAMLATCVVNGWPPETYLDPAHPLQRAIRATVEELTCERVAATGVDGCGAPLFFVSMVGVTRAFRAMVQAEPGTPERRVVDAFRDHPEWTSGTTRPEARLMRAVPGLMVKAGAEAFDAFVFSDGRSGTVKVEDGGQRARVPAVVEALGALGFRGPELDELATGVLLGGGRPVGEIRLRR